MSVLRVKYRDFSCFWGILGAEFRCFWGLFAFELGAGCLLDLRMWGQHAYETFDISPTITHISFTIILCTTELCSFTKVIHNLCPYLWIVYAVDNKCQSRFTHSPIYETITPSLCLSDSRQSYLYVQGQYQQTCLHTALCLCIYSRCVLSWVIKGIVYRGMGAHHCRAFFAALAVASRLKIPD